METKKMLVFTALVPVFRHQGCEDSANFFVFQEFAHVVIHDVF